VGNKQWRGINDAPINVRGVARGMATVMNVVIMTLIDA